MKKYKYFFLTFTLLPGGGICFAQDTAAFEIRFDSEFLQKSSTASVFGYNYYIAHSPTKEDSKFCSKYSSLITAEPTKWNYINYYKLACSLWELKRLTEAEKMFLKIIESKAPYYAQSSYHSSDIPGDRTISIYGYGSYTSDYKNYACRYLTKIYIAQKKFEQALKYIKLADKVYTVVQGCGTGHMWYRQEIDALYALCYEGLGKKKEKKPKT